MAEYTFDVQKLYLEMLLADAESFARAQNIFTPKSFDRKLQPIAKFIKDYVDKYKVMPEVEQVNAKFDIKLKTAKDLDPSHFDWLLDEFETFSRHKALESAILQSADLLEKGDYAPVEDMIKDAVNVGLTRDLGTDYFDDPKGRLEFLKNSHGQVSTGWPAIDKKLFGGFSKGELNIFAGGSGAGKSLFLQNLGLNWALAGLNVVYISFELSEHLAAMRIDAMITNIPTRQVMKSMSDVEMKVKMVSKKAGNLQLKYMPASSTIMDIKSYIKELELKNKKRIDAVLIDYLDLMMMMNLAIWLKRNDFRADQVQAYLPSPMSAAAAMYHSGKDTLHKVRRKGGDIEVPKGLKVRRLHKAFLRYHDPENWPMLREALKKMGRADLIGNGKKHLIPSWQPAGTGDLGEGRRVTRKAKTQSFKTQHTRPGKLAGKKRRRQ